MIAKDCARKVGGVMTALVILGSVGPVNPATAQQKTARGKAAAAATAPAPATADANTPPVYGFAQKAIPVNPTDPIAHINDDVITRKQLADECVARKGEEILETLIVKKLIEQALKANKLEVTASEVDREIDNVAMRVAGIGREAWLRTLDKERGISPVQYARDIIYPALALRKLAAPSVQVTPNDERAAFEAQYGDKLRCRMIMVDKLQTVKEIWEEVRKNPGGFEKLAMERSMDSGSRSLGGLLAEPISRHAYPQNVSDAAFSQLVDGDPKDTDPSHKPKNGDFTGPIQVAEATWIILRREDVIPAQKVNPDDPAVKKATHDMIFEVKLKEAMGAYMVGLMQAARIDNKLTGKIKLANEQIDVDKEVQLMGNKSGTPGGSTTSTARPTPAGTNQPKLKTPTPAALSPEVAKQAESLTRPAAK